VGNVSGLAIGGLEPVGLEAILALPERREEIENRLEAVSSRIRADFFEPEEVRRRSERYEDATNALSSGLHLLQIFCEKGIKIAGQAIHQEQANNDANREKTIAALDEINCSINGSEVKEIAGFLLPTEMSAMDSNIKPGNTEAAYLAYLEASIKLYQSLAESANFT
jgi:hypothetical protein